LSHVLGDEECLQGGFDGVLELVERGREEEDR